MTAMLNGISLALLPCPSLQEAPRKSKSEPAGSVSLVAYSRQGKTRSANYYECWFLPAFACLPYLIMNLNIHGNWLRTILMRYSLCTTVLLTLDNYIKKCLHSNILVCLWSLVKKLQKNCKAPYNILFTLIFYMTNLQFQNICLCKYVAFA